MALTIIDTSATFHKYETKNILHNTSIAVKSYQDVGLRLLIALEALEPEWLVQIQFLEANRQLRNLRVSALAKYCSCLLQCLVIGVSRVGLHGTLG